MKLFHHFETSTCHTLLLPAQVWDTAMQLCPQYGFLMHTVLCISARHLAVLQPRDEAYPTAATSHLCRALSLFRHELSKDFTAIRLDALVATILLLQIELWASIDGPPSLDSDPTRDNIVADRLFLVSSSVKQLFLNTLPRIARQPSVFLPQLQQDHRAVLIQTAQITSGTLTRYHDFYAYSRPLNAELLNPPCPDEEATHLAKSACRQHCVPERVGEHADPVRNGYEPAISRLCLVQAFADEVERRSDAAGAKPPLSPELARYIFSFPVACHGAFASMLQEHDPHAVLVVYHFYGAVKKLLPRDEYWWAHDRAAASEATLRSG